MKLHAPYHRFITCIMVCATLAACGTSSKQQALDYQASAALKTCEQLATDRLFVHKVIEGLQLRQQNQGTPLDVAAAVVSMGYSVIDNQVSRDKRDARISRQHQKLALIEQLMQQKGCTQ